MHTPQTSWILAGALAITFAFASPTTAASMILVDGSDTTADAGGCGSNANPCNTIQAGIDNAAPGDVVAVKAGTYAGAVVNKAVHLRARGKVTIDTGPFTHPGALRGGFIFEAGGAGSGASIEKFTFAGTIQTGFGPDDGKLDFAIFSRGADGVSVQHNSIVNTLQGITNWNGVDWDIAHNTLVDLWTICGGGIGILVGGFDGSAITGHRVAHNTVKGTVRVSPGDCGGYDATGITLYADFRFGRAGASTVSDNVIEHNKVELVSDAPGVVNANGLELTVGTSVPGTEPVVMTDNLVAKNHLTGNSGNAIAVTAGTLDNLLEKNHATGSGETDVVDDSLGSGTSGTANIWEKNKCSTSSPAGLCS
jgi:hypothetical protein